MVLMLNVRSLRDVAASRRLAMVGLIAILFFFSAPAWAQISLVHATPCGTATFPVTSCTIPATASGDLLVVAWSAAFGNIPTTTNISDNAGNSYAQAGNARAVDTAAAQTVDIWYSKNAQPGATSVTITPSANVTGAAMIWEFSGADIAAPLDQTLVLNSQAATATPSSGSIATSSGEAVVSVTVPAGTMVGLQTGSAFVADSINFGVGWAHLLAPSAGTYAAQWNTSAGTYASSTVSFKAAATGGTPLNACDLNSDGLDNILDVNRSVNMTLGLSPCTADINGPNVCTVVTVQRVVNSVLGAGCRVDAASLTPTGLSCNPSSVNTSGTSACTGTLSAAAPSGGLTLALSSNNANAIVPSNVTVASGASTFGFTATVGSISTNQTAVLTASANGASATASLSLIAPTQQVSHSATLTWVASTSSNVAGYNVYRGTTSGGPYSTKANSSLVTGLTYTDTAVLAGQTYYYVLTAVDSSGNESGYSTEAAATIPTP